VVRAASDHRSCDQSIPLGNGPTAALNPIRPVVELGWNCMQVLRAARQVRLLKALFVPFATSSDGGPGGVFSVYNCRKATCATSGSLIGIAVVSILGHTRPGGAEHRFILKRSGLAKTTRHHRDFCGNWRYRRQPAHRLN